MNVLDTFKEFIQDQYAWNMYITGVAGTGKTTELYKEVQFCIDNNISYVACAFTHKACKVLASKLPKGANIRTLHSLINKVPRINQDSTNVKAIDSNFSSPVDLGRIKVIFIDEYSMIGEDDVATIVEIQDPDYTSLPKVKVVYIGDPHQLPPVKGKAGVVPEGSYQVTLTKIHRTEDSNPLRDTLASLVDMIEGADLEPLVEHSNFKKGLNIFRQYKLSETSDKIILAYTNKCVECANRYIAGRDYFEPNDILFSPTTRKKYFYLKELQSTDVKEIVTSNQTLLGLGTKYKTLEYLKANKLSSFALVENEEGISYPVAYVYGHYAYKVLLERLQLAAVKSNEAIVKKHGNVSPSVWARANYKTKLARDRAKAWRDLLTFNECVICLDFSYAMTIHKSQGSTYDTVFIDAEDVYTCAERNQLLYLKLMYVAISRASNIVITN